MLQVIANFSIKNEGGNILFFNGVSSLDTSYFNVSPVSGKIQPNETLTMFATFYHFFQSNGFPC